MTFTESYLYYIFYNINKGAYSLKFQKAKGYIKANKPDDNQQSHLLPLISNRSEQLINALEVCTNLVKAIDNLLPSELKI